MGSAGSVPRDDYTFDYFEPERTHTVTLSGVTIPRLKLPELDPNWESEYDPSAPRVGSLHKPSPVRLPSMRLRRPRTKSDEWPDSAPPTRPPHLLKAHSLASGLSLKKAHSLASGQTSAEHTTLCTNRKCPSPCAVTMPLTTHTPVPSRMCLRARTRLHQVGARRGQRRLLAFHHSPRPPPRRHEFLFGSRAEKLGLLARNIAC